MYFLQCTIVVICMSCGDLEGFNSIVLVLIILVTLHFFFSFNCLTTLQVLFFNKHLIFHWMWSMSSFFLWWKWIVFLKVCIPCKGITYRFEKSIYPSACMRRSLPFQTPGYVQESFSSFYFTPKPCFQWMLWRAWDLSSKLKQLSSHVLECFGSKTYSILQNGI